MQGSRCGCEGSSGSPNRVGSRCGCTGTGSPNHTGSRCGCSAKGSTNQLENHLLRALVGDPIALVTGREPFTPTYGPRPAYHVSSVANALVEERAMAYEDQAYFGMESRPEKGLARLAWDATAKLAQRLEAEGVLMERARCGRFPDNAISREDDVYYVSVGPANAARALRIAEQIQRQPGFSALRVASCARGDVGFSW